MELGGENLAGRIRHSIEIARPPADVWPWLDEPDRFRQWAKGVEEHRIVDDTRFVMTLREGRRRSEYQGEVLLREPPARLVVKLSGGSLPGDMAMFADYRLTDLGGRTRLDYEAGARVSGILFRVLAGVFKLFGKMQIRAFFRTLKAKVEAEGAAAAPDVPRPPAPARRDDDDA